MLLGWLDIAIHLGHSVYWILDTGYLVLMDGEGVQGTATRIEDQSQSGEAIKDFPLSPLGILILTSNKMTVCRSWSKLTYPSCRLILCEESAEGNLEATLSTVSSFTVGSWV